MISVVNHSLKRAALLLSLPLLIVTLLACTPDSAIPNFKLTGFTMGTSYHVTVVDPRDQFSPQLLQAQIDSLLAEVNQQMSTYIPESELSMLNRVPNKLPFEVDPALFDLLLQALEISWLSNGAFDVTVDPLVKLWGFGPEKFSVDRVPSQAQIEAALANVGYQYLVLDISNNTVQKTRPVTIDLSAIAKGYGVDQVATLLRKAGIENFMVEIGGELSVAGNNATGKPWRIAIEQPGPQPGQVHRALAISNAAMATSGDYRNFFELDGQRYSHTIDPVTGWPVRHNLVSVTVIAQSAAYADALATAIDVMGVSRGMKLANELGLAVYLISRSANGFTVDYSDAFKVYLD